MKGILDCDESLYFEDIQDSEQEITDIVDYDISVSPNDFNLKTLFDFIDSGIVKIPGFQRNYVWDIKRASKLIESLLIGVPIPQIFLYEEKKNSFLVIDGQQRLMTIYYFKKKRFPRTEKRAELRQIFEERKGIPDEILNDNIYFSDFNLDLHETLPNKTNRFNKKNYFTLKSEDQIALDLKTIRNIIIKQNAPDDGDTVIFEIFNRLNSGGVNLKAQEIRTSLYHSPFYDMLYRININQLWRTQTPKNIPDLNMKDIEILLRGFAMLWEGNEYAPSMTKFLNNFSQSMKSVSNECVQKLERLFTNFINEIVNLQGDKLFFTNQRFNISVYEAIFVGLCEEGWVNETLEIKNTTLAKIDLLKNDPEFIGATQKGTANTANVAKRLLKAKEIL